MDKKEVKANFEWKKVVDSGEPVTAMEWMNNLYDIPMYYCKLIVDGYLKEQGKEE